MSTTHRVCLRCAVASTLALTALLSVSAPEGRLHAQPKCELVANRPTLVTPLRMFGEGGRTCFGPAESARVRVRLRQDRRWWPDPTLADRSENATGGNFIFGVARNCTHFETRRVYIQTTSALNGSTESPRITLQCIGG